MAPGHHDGAGGIATRELAEQPALADSRLAGEDDEPPTGADSGTGSL
jgi:hypothetical protein